MRGIFISYRRDDSEGQAGRLFDDLSSHFGRDAVFMDVAAIRKGLDFRRIIHEHVTSCGVLLVIIGKRWLEVTDDCGRRRLDDANDFVRLEIAAALSRGIPVVPVRVHGAAMPTEQELPDALKELAFRNGTELTHARWDSDVQSLIEDLESCVEAPSAPLRDPPPTEAVHRGSPERSRASFSSWAVGGAAAFAAAASIVGYQLLHERPRVTDRPTVAARAPHTTDARPDTPDKERPPVVKAADETAKQALAQAEAAKAAADKAAADAATAKAAAERAAAARRAAEERRRREEADRAALLAEEQRRRDEEQRKRDEENRRLAAEQAKQQQLAAEQAEAAKIFRGFAEALIGSRQNNRRTN